MDKVTLRPYQSEMILKVIRLLRRDRVTALVSAVGSGKTLMSKCIIHKMGFRKVIIATPFLHIGKDFETLEDTLYSREGSFGAGSSYYIRSGHFEFIDDKSVSTVRSLISGTVGANPHIITHHTLARLDHFFSRL